MSREPPTISSRALQKLLRVLGPHADAVRAAAGVDEAVLEDPDGRIAVARLHAAWERALPHFGRGEGPLVVARSYAPSDYGLLGFVSTSSATVGDGLAQFVRFGALWMDDPVPTFETSNEDGVLRFGHGTPGGESAGVRCAIEAGIAEVLNAARFMTRTEIRPVEVSFAHRPPEVVDAHTAFFGCPVRFGAEATMLRFTKETLALPLLRADPPLARFLSALATKALPTPAPASTLTEKVRRLFDEELQVPSVDTVARRLAMAERTLRRRLEEEGTSFRALLDERRAACAQRYLADGLSTKEVAFLLGFSDSSAFHRAFKRWTGLSPGPWRAQHARSTSHARHLPPQRSPHARHAQP